MTSNYFTYNKAKVIQALRYHFITRKEIKIMMIVVNVFSIVCAILFFCKLISPFAFLISSLLWFVLMILFWFFLPNYIYKKENTFKDRFKATISPSEFEIENERGSRSWAWKNIVNFIESPHFFHIYFSKTAFFIVPKDAFHEDEIFEVRKILKEKLG